MKAKRNLLYLLLIMAALFFFSIYKISDYKPAAELKNTDVILILGYSLNDDDTPSPILEQRLEDGLFLFNNNFSGKIIVSGGMGPTDNQTVASSMKSWLTSRGVPASSIILEENSRDTIENFKFSSDICKEEAFKSITVVTSDFHMYRTGIISDLFFEDADFYTQEYFTYSPMSLEKAFNLLKEPFSLVKVYFYKFLWIKLLGEF